MSPEIPESDKSIAKEILIALIKSNSGLFLNPQLSQDKALSVDLVTSAYRQIFKAVQNPQSS